METFMASSPPAWNAEIPAPRDRSEGGSDMESDDDDDLDIQDIPNAHFDVLDTSRSTGESKLDSRVADDRTSNATSGCHRSERPGESVAQTKMALRYPIALPTHGSHVGDLQIARSAWDGMEKEEGHCLARYRNSTREQRVLVGGGADSRCLYGTDWE